MPHIGLYVISANRNSYIIAKTLAVGGCRVSVHCEIPYGLLVSRPDEPGHAEREYTSWLYSDEQIEVIRETRTAPQVDGLLYEIGHHSPRYPDGLRAWMGRAKRVVAWNTNDN